MDVIIELKKSIGMEREMNNKTHFCVGIIYRSLHSTC